MTNNRSYIITDQSGNETFMRPSRADHDMIIQRLTKLGYNVQPISERVSRVDPGYRRDILKAYVQDVTTEEAL